MRFLTPRRAAAAGCPYGREDVRQAQVDLAPLQVDADHLHTDAITEPVDAVVLLAAENVRTLDKPIVVVRHGRHVDHALDEMLDEFDIQPKRADADAFY